MGTTRASAIALVHPRMAFDGHPDLATVGVEEEFLLVRPWDGGLAPVAEELLERLAGDGRFSYEFRASQVEATTSVALTAHDVERELVAARSALAAAGGADAVPLAVPAYPGPTALAPIVDRDRYTGIARQAPWAARGLQTCGMHVHVGLRGADRALAVANTLRSYLPLLGALAANSPFYDGEDVGVASVRAHLNRALPRSGVPPAFPCWDAYEAFLGWGGRGGVIPDPSLHWYDLRLNVAYGTIEVRVFDVQTEVESAGALAALTHALVVWLAQRYDEGETLPVHPDHLIREAAWLAERDGAGAGLVDLDTGALVPVDELVSELVECLAPSARELGTADLLARIPSIAELGGAERQRLVASGRGLRGLVGWLQSRTVSPAAAEASRSISSAR